MEYLYLYTFLLKIKKRNDNKTKREKNCLEFLLFVLLLQAITHTIYLQHTHQSSNIDKNFRYVLCSRIKGKPFYKYRRAKPKHYNIFSTDHFLLFCCENNSSIVCIPQIFTDSARQKIIGTLKDENKTLFIV